MTLYCGIDLHSNNYYVCVIDDNDKRLLEMKLANDSQQLIAALSEYKDELLAVAIESTFNWYWLSDALIEAGSEVRLVNTTKVVQYSGLKRADDRYDEFFLAHLMRLNILPTGFINAEAQPILQRLSITPQHWIYLCTHFESRFKGLVGSVHSLEQACKQLRLFLRIIIQVGWQSPVIPMYDLLVS